MKDCTAGIVQFDVRSGDVDANVRRVTRSITRLAEKGTRLVVLPEMWSTGFAYDHLGRLAETTPHVLQEVARLSKASGIVIIGSLPEKKGGRIFNTAYVTDADGTLAAAYRKIHLFSPTGEHLHFHGGKKAVVAQTALGPIGLMICYDLRFPELSRRLCLSGARIVVVSAQWPAARVAHWKALLVARAIENQLFVLGANGCGREGKRIYGGHSRIVSPWGEVLAKAGRGPEAITALLDLAMIEKIRDQVPCLRDRVPRAYG